MPPARLLEEPQLIRLHAEQDAAWSPSGAGHATGGQVVRRIFFSHLTVLPQRHTASRIASVAMRNDKRRCQPHSAPKFGSDLLALESEFRFLGLRWQDHVRETGVGEASGQRNRLHHAEGQAERTRGGSAGRRGDPDSALSPLEPVDPEIVAGQYNPAAPGAKPVMLGTRKADLLD